MAEKNYRRYGSRFKARRRAVDILFEAETRDVDPVTIVEDRVELAAQRESGVAPVPDYTAVIVAGAAEKLDEIDEAIERYLSIEWELRRLPAVDRAVLRVGAWEIMYQDEVAAPISIVDAVEIASQYSTEAAAPYINAVLDDIAQSAAEGNPMAAEVAPEVETEDEPQGEASAEVEPEAEPEVVTGVELETETENEKE